MSVGLSCPCPGVPVACSLLPEAILWLTPSDPSPRPPTPPSPFPAPFTASFCSIRVSRPQGWWLPACGRLARGSPHLLLLQTHTKLPAPTSLAAGPGPVTVWVQKISQSLQTSALSAFWLEGLQESRREGNAKDGRTQIGPGLHLKMFRGGGCPGRPPSDRCMQEMSFPM